MAQIALIGGAGGFVNIKPITLTSGEISAFGTQVSLANISAEGFNLANGRAATEYSTLELTTGNTLRAAKRGVTVDTATGSTVAAGDTKDTFTFTAAVTQAELASIRGILKAGTPLAIAAASRNVNTGAILEYGYLFGYLDGEMAIEGSAEFATISMTVAGGVGFVAAAGVDETDLTFSAVTPSGASAVTVPSPSTGNFADLLAGEAAFQTPA